jgi:hypothetical protein
MKPYSLLAHKRFLKAMLACLNKPIHKEYGICAHIFFNKPNYYDYRKIKNSLEIYWQSWPLYSGIPKYPVPDRLKKVSPEWAFHNRELWAINTTYGANRILLLRWLQENIQRELDEL